MNNKKSHRVVIKGWFCLAMLLSLSVHSLASPEDWAGYVNPFIGTVRGSGSTYPGAQRPFGMVSFSPHTEEGNHGSGYQYTCDKIKGFGLVHLSGVGCDATCELPFMPVTGPLEFSPVTHKQVYSSSYNHKKENASPGYYSVVLDRYQVGVALTASLRGAMGQFLYTAKDPAHLLFNPADSANGLREGRIDIDPENNTISGWIKGGGFCHVKSNDYTIYYTVIFDHPFKDYGFWQADRKVSGISELTGNDIAAFVSFDTGLPMTVTMKTGISFVSLANARQNLQSEIPSWNFPELKTAARTDWNQVLDKIQVKGDTEDDKTLFYTALYHALLLPSIFDDVNGQYMGMDNQIYTVRPGHHAYSTFSGWDTYRTQAQLWGLLYPQAAGDLCQTFLETSRQTQFKGGGGLPLWSMFNDETMIMSGYPAAPFIASAWAFGARDFDVESLTHVMVDSATHNRFWGRNNHVSWQHLEDYMQYGYYPDNCGIAHAISQNVEYAVADFAIARMCEAIGDDKNRQYFLQRSQSIFQLMHPDRKYLWARMKDGSWKQDFDPFTSAGCQEGTSTHYTWGIPHNLNRLIDEMGGKRVAEERLDQLMSKIALGYDYGNPYYLAGNEPCFGIVPVYNWIGSPWKAQMQMRRVMNASFSNKPTGIPGDDDSGAMSAWYVFAALGLYPEIPGVGGFAVTGPLFPEIRLNLPADRQVVIQAENAGQATPYIQEIRLNGSDCQKTWLTLEELSRQPKTIISLTMSSTPNLSWGKDYQIPSYSPK